MSATPRPITRPKRGQPPFECVALLLQGGGALGAYQAGVYEALAEAEHPPELGGRYFNWRNQRRSHRRQSAEQTGGSPKRILETK